jgi:DNA repair photolyase
VEEFNRITKGFKNPISRIPSDTGAGEWGGYRCNIGSGCSYGCPGCYAEGMADRFNRIESAEEWLVEELRDASTAKCRKYSEWIMFPTTHDISAHYLPAYRCHLYNILKAENRVLIVTKPRRESIEAICSKFSSFRDNIVFRFTIGGLDNEALRVWNPGAPNLQERLWCLRYAFEQGFRTSISSEPILVNCQDAERLYYAVEPLVTEDIWFGKMSGVGGLRKHPDPEVARRAAELMEVYRDDNIMEFVRRMAGLPKVQWKDAIKDVIKKYAGDES